MRPTLVLLDWNGTLADNSNQLHPYANTLLHNLKANGVRIGIVSDGAAAFIREDLGNSRQYIDFIVGEAGKPNPGKLLNQLASVSGSTVFVGDSTLDRDLVRNYNNATKSHSSGKMAFIGIGSMGVDKRLHQYSVRSLNDVPAAIANIPERTNKR